jgi:hypothetical protein
MKVLTEKQVAHCRRHGFLHSFPLLDEAARQDKAVSTAWRADDR